MMDIPARRRIMSKSRLARVISIVVAASCVVTVRGEQPAKVDAHGDPLPAGAIARLGTVRWRHGDGASFVAFLPDGKVLLSVGHDATVRQWDMTTGKELSRFALPNDFAGDLDLANQVVMRRMIFDIGGGTHTFALAADGKVLASSAAGNSVQLWDVATGKQLKNIASAGGAMAVALTADSKTLAVHGADGTIRVYDVATGKESIKFGKNPEKDNQSMGSSIVF